MPRWFDERLLSGVKQTSHFKGVTTVFDTHLGFKARRFLLQCTTTDHPGTCYS
jgi:hypothetical protein